jgi:hypothetical protein
MLTKLLDKELEEETLEVKSRKEVLREEIKKVSTVIDKSFIRLAELLYEAKQNLYYRDWGYLSFKDYVQYEVGMSDRKGESLVEIWDRAMHLGVDPDRLKNMGWVKARHILRVATSDTFEEWAEKAETLRVNELVSEIAVAKDTGVVGKEISADKTVTIKLVMNETESRIVTSAIEEAKTITQSDNIALAIVTICEDWITQAGVVPMALNLDDRIAFLEKMYNVKLEVTKLNENAVVGSMPKAAIKELEDEEWEDEEELDDDILTDKDIEEILKS